MSTYERRLAAAAEKRLSVLLHDAVHLNLQFSELNRLRDRVGQAELSARKSLRTGNRKSRRRDEIKGQAAL
jgi:hypothetical protein